ncbi:jun dimerization protein 2 isoform X3 [Odocoileus virginianus]|uniref:Jun dimerization protein 2 isoform X3 n=1 Tax=Odocoileus virginianus TaxID=9874 RepID=A0ABM4ID56_ODOVR
MDYSPPGSSVHGTLQARISQWVAISFSRGSSRPLWGVESTSLICLLPCQLDEEEERRKRRREKNKVAAARCRNKKKERTEFLQRESERLELMNAELKTQIEELKQERQQLILMLNRHRPTCIVRTDSVKTPESEGNPLLEQLEKK